jgi:hypothetical protein
MLKPADTLIVTTVLRQNCAYYMREQHRCKDSVRSDGTQIESPARKPGADYKIFLVQPEVHFDVDLHRHGLPIFAGRLKLPGADGVHSLFIQT